MAGPDDLAPVGADAPVPAAEADDGEPTASLADGLRELADDAQTLLEAELAFQSARAGYALSRGRAVGLWLLAAATAAVFAMVALVVGLLLALIPLAGAWGALGIVTLGLVLIALLALVQARSRIRRMRATLAANPLVPPVTGPAAGPASGDAP